MRWTRDRRRRTVASALALVLPLLLQAPSGAATETTETAARSRPLQIVDLGTLPGALSSWASGINDRGWVVGSSDMGNMTSHGFLWWHGRMTDLGALDGPSGSSIANDINKRGEVVGLSSSRAHDGAHAFLWRRGRMTDLGTLGGGFTTATGINDRGEVVGYGLTPNGEPHALLWRRGRMTDLGTAEGETLSSAEAINNRGQVVGTSGGPVAWRRGVLTRLPAAPNFASGVATDDNDRGDIVGHSFFTNSSGGSLEHAVIWRRGVMTDLGLEGGESQAFGVNDRGQVVGYRELVPFSRFAGFLWEDGKVTNLGSLTGASGYATAINNRGEVVGLSPAPNDTTHAVLWH